MMTKLMSILLLATPFVILPFANENFEFPKMFLVYFLGSFAILNCTLSAKSSFSFAKTKEFIKNHKTFVPAFLFVFSHFISTLFSTHQYTSIWGYFSRFNGGLMSQLIFFGLYTFLLVKKTNLTKIPVLAALTIIPTSLFALIQALEKERVYSTFGQPNWYAAYCSMVLPIALYLALEKSKIWYFVFYIGFLGFWRSNSLSGVIALIFSLVAFLILNFSLAKKHWHKLVILAAACLFSIYPNLGFFKQRVNDALVDIAPQKRKNLAQIPQAQSQNKPNYQHEKYLISDSGFIRKGLWQGSINLWTSSIKNFLIGTGPETFAYEFQKFRPSFLNYSSEWNYILNKPHNYYLELLTQLGLFGAIFYLLIIIAVLKAKHPVFTPSLAGLFVSNFFGWPSVYTNLLFWFFLAGIEKSQTPSLYVNTEKAKIPNNVETSIPQLNYAKLIMLTFYLYVNTLFARYFLADLASKSSNNYLEKKLTHKAYKLALLSTQLNTKEPLYQRQLAKIYIIANEKNKAYKTMQNSYNLNPKNLATIRGLVPLYYFLSIKHTNEPIVSSDKIISNPPYDNYYLEITKNFYIQVSNTYPKDVGIQTQIAKYQRLLNLENDLNATKEKIKHLRPDLLDWYIKL